MDEIQKKLLEDQVGRTKFAQDLAIEQMKQARMNPEQLEQDAFQNKQEFLNFRPRNVLGQHPLPEASPDYIPPSKPIAPHDPTMDAILEQLLRKK